MYEPTKMGPLVLMPAWVMPNDLCALEGVVAVMGLCGPPRVLRLLRTSLLVARERPCTPGLERCAGSVGTVQIGVRWSWFF